MKQTNDITLAENLSPLTKKLDNFKESIKQLGEIVKKSYVADGNTQTPAFENTTTPQSLRDNLSFTKSSKNFFKLEQT